MKAIQDVIDTVKRNEKRMYEGRPFYADPNEPERPKLAPPMPDIDLIDGLSPREAKRLKEQWLLQHAGNMLVPVPTGERITVETFDGPISVNPAFRYMTVDEIRAELGRGPTIPSERR